MVEMASRPARPRWQLTRRPRVAAVLGTAGLVAAVAQVLLSSSPPRWFEVVVTGFWSVVGVAYLGSALAQHHRERPRPRHRAPAARVPAPVAVPTPTRPFESPAPAGEPTAVAEPARVPVLVGAPSAAESTDVRLSPWPMVAAVRALHAAVDSRPAEHTDVHALTPRDVLSSPALVGAGTGRTARR